jgi:hypothetical protein
MADIPGIGVPQAVYDAQKLAVEQFMDRPEGFVKGIGISKTPAGEFAVALLVGYETPVDFVPTQIDGVPVVWHYTGEIKAQ